MAAVNFRAGTLAQYTAATKNENTLYFITDAKKIYKGSVDVTESIVLVTNFTGAEGGISVENAFEGKLYINATTFEVRIKSGSAWVILTPGYLTDSTNWATADGDKFATISLIKSGIAAAIEEIKGDSALVSGLSWTAESGAGTGKLVVTRGDGTTADVALTGVPYSIAYDKDALTLTISKYGEAEGQVINLPKDNFVRSGTYDSDTKEIVLTVGDGTSTSEVRIPAASLVDVYTGKASDNITVSVNDSNEITATAIIDPAEGNALVSSATGLKVDISGKADKLTADAATHILIGSADGNLADGGVTLKTSGDMGNSATEVPVASVIASAISAAVQAAQGTLQSAIDAVSGRVATIEGQIEGFVTDDELNTAISSILGAGTADEVVISTAEGAVARSGKKIGGATLSSVPDSSTVATEAAVSAALSWSTIN